MGISKGLKKKGRGTVTAAGKEQGKDVVKDENVSKKKNEVEEKEVLGSKPSHSKVTGKSSKSEIDEIFGNKKRKVVVDEAGGSAGATKEKKKVKGAGTAMPVQTSSNKSTSSASGGKPRKKTIDGFTVYSGDEIGWNKNNAGGTPLCPFDCSCCF